MFVSKRTELDAYKLKIDKSFPEQIIKFEKLAFYYKEIRGTMSDSYLTYLLIKGLPNSYKEKLSNLLSLKAGYIIFNEVKILLSIIYERNVVRHGIIPTLLPKRNCTIN